MPLTSILHSTNLSVYYSNTLIILLNIVQAAMVVTSSNVLLKSHLLFYRVHLLNDYSSVIKYLCMESGCGRDCYSICYIPGLLSELSNKLVRMQRLDSKGLAPVNLISR